MYKKMMLILVLMLVTGVLIIGCTSLIEKPEELARQALQITISDAESTINNATIGSNYGEYPQIAKDDLQNIIGNAQNKLNKTSVTISELNNVNNQLREAIKLFNWRQNIILRESFECSQTDFNNSYNIFVFYIINLYYYTMVHFFFFF